MKKSVTLVLLVIALALTLFSCDGNIIPNITNFMGKFSGNVYLDNGLVTANTAQAEAAAQAVASIGSGASATSTANDVLPQAIKDLLGPIDETTTILKPQTTEEQQDLKNNIEDALNSPAQTEKLKEELGKPVTDDQKDAAQGTVSTINAVVTVLSDNLAGSGNTELAAVVNNLQLPDVGDNPTQADLLILQLMTNLVSNTVNTLASGVNESGGIEGGIEDLDTDALVDLVEDALFIAKMVDQLSGSASIDFAGSLDLAAIFSLIGGDENRSRGLLDDSDFGQYLPAVEDLLPQILGWMGVQYNADGFDYAPADYAAFLNSQKAYRANLEHAMTLLYKGQPARLPAEARNIDTSTLIKYLLSVVITENDGFVRAKETLLGNSDGASQTQKIAEFLEVFFDANLDYENGKLIINPDEGAMDDLKTYYAEEQLKTYLEGKILPVPPSGDAIYFQNILRTLLQLNRLATIGVPGLENQEVETGVTLKTLADDNSVFIQLLNSL